MRIAHGKLQLLLDGKEIPIVSARYEASSCHPRFFDISLVAQAYQPLTFHINTLIPRDNCEGNAYSPLFDGMLEKVEAAS